MKVGRRHFWGAWVRGFRGFAQGAAVIHSLCTADPITSGISLFLHPIVINSSIGTVLQVAFFDAGIGKRPSFAFCEP